MRTTLNIEEPPLNPDKYKIPWDCLLKAIKALLRFLESDKILE